MLNPGPGADLITLRPRPQIKGLFMGMDFQAQEKYDEVDILRFDDLVEHEKPVASHRPDTARDTWFSLIQYWIAELIWRVRFWNKTRDLY
jgi:hypothetical protein